MLSKSIEGKKDPYNYLTNYKYIEGSGKEKSLSIPFINSDNDKEIIKNSQFISEIEIVDLCSSSEITDVYLCDVTKEISGKNNMTEDNQIMVVFFKDTVSIGDKYIVMLNSDTSTSLIYTLSSDKSVKNVGEEKNIVNTLHE